MNVWWWLLTKLTVTSTTAACVPLCSLDSDAEGDCVARFPAQCFLWASPWAEGSSNLQHHHVPLWFLDFRNSSCRETTPQAQFCLLMVGRQRKTQLPLPVMGTQCCESGLCPSCRSAWGLHKDPHGTCLSPLTFNPKKTPGMAPDAWCWLRQTSSTLGKWEEFSFTWENVACNQTRVSWPQLIIPTAGTCPVP